MKVTYHEVCSCRQYRQCAHDPETASIAAAAAPLLLLLILLVSRMRTLQCWTSVRLSRAACTPTSVYRGEDMNSSRGKAASKEASEPQAVGSRP